MSSHIKYYQQVVDAKDPFFKCTLFLENKNKNLPFLAALTPYDAVKDKKQYKNQVILLQWDYNAR